MVEKNYYMLYNIVKYTMKTGDSVKLTFDGGIHIKGCKNTAGIKTVDFFDVKQVAIPLTQHIGAPCHATVAVGEHVDIGQCVGENEAALCCPVHASVSGTVKAVEERVVANGSRVTHIIIENDGKQTVFGGLKGTEKTLTELTADEIIEAVRKGGIVGMGGAAFPTYQKIRSALGKAKNLIINCAECEPYITSNHRLLIEQPEAVVKGIKILIHALGLRRATVAIEDNKQDAINALRKAINDKALIGIKVLETKYPQGDERQIINALYGKELPAGKLPADIGCVIFNAETVASIYRVLASGMPVVYKRVTVDGNAIKKPMNLQVPVGTSYGEIAEYCGGTKKRFSRLIVGGPMMGNAQWSLDSAVTKSTNALLFFADSDERVGQCIRCGKCMTVCQMRLMPTLLAAYSEKELYDECEKLNVKSCVECGCCTYICPAKIPIVQYIRNAKTVITNREKLRKEKGDSAK